MEETSQARTVDAPGAATSPDVRGAEVTLNPFEILERSVRDRERDGRVNVGVLTLILDVPPGTSICLKRLRIDDRKERSEAHHVEHGRADLRSCVQMAAQGRHLRQWLLDRGR